MAAKWPKICDQIAKGAWSHNCKHTCYLFNLYCCLHVAIVFRTNFGGWAESTRKLFQKSTNISAIAQHMWSVSFVSLVAEKNPCDTAYQNIVKSSYRKKLFTLLDQVSLIKSLPRKTKEAQFSWSYLLRCHL